MKKFLYLILFSTLAEYSSAQLHVDTFAIQDFEVAPVSPTWTFTGPVVYNSGFSSATAAPPNSPIGIGGSQAWESTLNSSGLVLTFANIVIPAGYDSIRIRFNLAAMNLNGSSGGPDNLDYVLTEISTDTGATWYNRLRIRGAVANNSFWEYAATGVAKVDYLPASEVVFAPTNSGLQTTEGYSTCEIVFPGSVSNVRVRITGRSSTSTDTWLIDNLVITGEYILTGEEESEIKNGVTIFPNPCMSEFRLQNTESKLERMEVYDGFGQAICCQPHTFNLKLQTIDVSSWKAGIYFVKIFTAEKVFLRKVVKL